MRKPRIVVTVAATVASVLMSGGTALAFGGFGNPTSFLVENPYQVALGDLDGDGNTDVVTSVDGATSDGFAFALGNGAGAFGSAQFVPASTTNPEGVTIGKFDGDRDRDVAVSDYLNDSVQFFFGTDGGDFSSGPVRAAGPGAFLLRTGDFNEDGRTDVVSCNYNSNGPKAISVLIQKRHGFKAHKDFAGVANCYGIDVGRLNHDKHLDVVEQGGSGAFAVLLGKGDGTFKAHRNHRAFGSNGGYDNVTLGDFTGDGINDVAVASFADTQVLVYPGNRSGSLKDPKRTVLDGNPDGIEAGDFDRDGKLDLALDVAPQLEVLFGKGNGKFKAQPETAPLPSGRHLTAGRLNHDKAPDLAAVGQNNTAYVYINGNP